MTIRDSAASILYAISSLVSILSGSDRFFQKIEEYTLWKTADRMIITEADTITRG